MKISHVVLGSAIAVALVGGSGLAMPAAAQDDCVTIYGGDISNDTSIWISADAGTAISDASAGSNNAATTNGGHPADVAFTDIASAGNGGVATAAANGGAVSTGNINSGGNVGNAIEVGDTVCGAYEAPAYDDVAAYDAEVVALPSTGVGVGELSGMFALLASAGAAAASFGLRRR